MDWHPRSSARLKSSDSSRQRGRLSGRLSLLNNLFGLGIGLPAKIAIDDFSSAEQNVGNGCDLGTMHELEFKRAITFELAPDGSEPPLLVARQSRRAVVVPHPENPAAVT